MSESAATNPDQVPDPPVRTVRGPGDRRVAYVEYGDPAGAPVVFLHGTPGSRLLAGLWADAAVERGVRLLAPDRPGYGRSDPWRGRTLADTGAAIEPVLDDAGVDTAGVVGFSGGGPHALAFAATRPERVTRVDLVGTVTPPDCVDESLPLQRVLGTLAARTPRLLGGLFRVQTALARRRTPDSVVAQYTTGDTDHVPAAATRLVYEDFLAAVGASRNGVVTELRLFDRSWDVSLDVSCPVALSHGELDTNAPVAAARRLADRLPDAALSTVETDHVGALVQTDRGVLYRQAAARDG